jgi:hypothetical protein
MHPIWRRWATQTYPKDAATSSNPLLLLLDHNSTCAVFKQLVLKNDHASIAF